MTLSPKDLANVIYGKLDSDKLDKLIQLDEHNTSLLGEAITKITLASPMITSKLINPHVLLDEKLELFIYGLPKEVGWVIYQELFQLYKSKNSDYLRIVNNEGYLDLRLAIWTWDLKYKDIKYANLQDFLVPHNVFELETETVEESKELVEILHKKLEKQYTMDFPFVPRTVVSSTVYNLKALSDRVKIKYNVEDWLAPHIHQPVNFQRTYEDYLDYYDFLEDNILPRQLAIPEKAYIVEEYVKFRNSGYLENFFRKPKDGFNPLINDFTYIIYNQGLPFSHVYSHKQLNNKGLQRLVDLAKKYTFKQNN